MERGRCFMQRLRTGIWVLPIAAILTLSSGCIASHKYVKKEVKTSADALTAQIDATNGQVKETQDSVNQVNTRVTAVDQRVSTVDQRVSGVDQKVTSVDQRLTGKVDEVDARATQGVNGLKGDVSNVNNKADTNSKNLS